MDAEADPNMACGSLVQLERFARIDLDTRITIDWRPIGTRTREVGEEIKNKTVSTVTGINDWFSAAGDKLLGRDRPAPAAPTSRLSSTF